MSFTDELAALFERDLNKLVENLDEMEKQHLWEAPDGVTNSCGVLAQHIVGNLNHFVGAALGDTGYVRKRDLEFTNTGRPKSELIEDIRDLIGILTEVIRGLDQEDLNAPYPGKISYEGSTRKILLHLYGHFSYHMGQVNYLRRIIAGNQAS
ncbi:MAG: DUF1572 family protein [Balneolaceae bacterium]|nr:DUF1572 family protein [Balneolaceae bacterium]